LLIEIIQQGSVKLVFDTALLVAFSDRKQKSKAPIWIRFSQEPVLQNVAGLTGLKGLHSPEI
jgi:hypothetical protein